MQQSEEKGGQGDGSLETTSHPGVPDGRKMTSRMRYHAIHHTGERLRRSKSIRTGERPDREGR